MAAGAVGFKTHAQEAGTYYFYNEESGKFLSRGATWGTHASADTYGIAFEITKVSDGVYTLKNVDHSLMGNANRYLGDNLYTDNGTACNFTFTEAGTGKYTLYKNTNEYLTIGASDTYGQIPVETTTDANNATIWTLMTKDAYKTKLAERDNAAISTLAASMNFANVTDLNSLKSYVSIAKTTNKTSSIGNAEIGGGSSAWTKSQTENKRKTGDAKAGDGVFQVWNGCADVNQTVTGLSKGLYKITVEAFLRFGDKEAAKRVTTNGSMTSYVYGNESKTLLHNFWDIRQDNDHPNSMSEASSQVIDKDDRALLECYTSVGDDGNLKLGIYLAGGFDNVWMICDNFTLTYIEDTPTDELTDKIKKIYAEYKGILGDHSVASDMTSAYNNFVASSTLANYYTLQEAVTAAKSPSELCREITKATQLGVGSDAIDAAQAVLDNGSSTEDDYIVATQNLKIAEYNYVTTTYEYGVDLGAWTTTGPTGSLSAQHYKGSGYSYLEQSTAAWSQSSWTIKYTQDLALPAGNYVFKVAGRQADSDGVTLSLTVKNGESVLGTVSDFPKGDTGLGINTSGETDFTTGEGHEYANNDAGRGWEWRYVKFTLVADATVNVAVDAVATTNHMWVSFCDATVQTDNEANISLISYNVALNNAQTVLADATYTNVAGTDKSSLEAAIAADGTLDKSNAEAINAATTALNTAATTFTSGVASWNAYVLAKGYGEAINSTALPYAVAAKLTAVTTAITATVNTAAEALAQANAINAANRAAYESNGIAENISGAKNRTSLITNADGSASAGWEGSSNFWTASNEAYTEADGNTTNTYFDKNGVKNFTASQTIKLPKGNYILSVTARAQAGINSYKMQVTNNASETAEVALTAMGNANGVFNRGWNDFTVAFEQKAYGDATITISAENSANFWMSWDRFRLYCIGEEGAVEIAEDADFTPVDMEDVDVTLNRTIKANVNTLVLPFNMTQSEVEEQFGVGSKVYVVKSYDADRENISFDVADGVTANVPCLLQATQAGTSYDLETRTIVAGALTYAPEEAGVSMTGNYAASQTVPEGAYVVSNGKIYVVDSEVTIAGTRAYISLTQPETPETPAKARVLTMSFEGDDATGIAVIENGNINIEKGTIYNLNGQRVANLTKGIYIVNGKKILVK